MFDLCLELFGLIFCFYIYLTMAFGNFRDVSEFCCIKLSFYSCGNNAFLINLLN